MIDLVIGVLAFIGASTIVFGTIIWLCAYWSTSSNFMGIQKRRK